MKKQLMLWGLIFCLLVSAAGCSKEASRTDQQAQPVNLTVAAAASLTDVSKELSKVYTAAHPNVTITYNFAASGTLQKQIEEGAPADLFISAAKSQMDNLAAKQLIIAASRQNLLGNELVLIGPKDSGLTGFDGLTGAAIGKIAIGTPESVPAGQYAKDTLISMGLWDKLQSKLVQAKDVRAVLTYVETGNVDAGLVYRTDAATKSTVKIVAAAPPGSSKPIVYPMAILASSKQQPEAQKFADFLASEEAMQVFARYGFTQPAQ